MGGRINRIQKSMLKEGGQEEQKKESRKPKVDLDKWTLPDRCWLRIPVLKFGDSFLSYLETKEEKRIKFWYILKTDTKIIAIK